MRDDEWLESLAAGVGVVVWSWSGPGRSRYRLTKVERLTKTRIVVDGKHYNRKTGREIGVTYHAAYLKNPADCERGIAESRRHDLLLKIRMKDIEKLGEVELQKIIDIISGATVEAGREA